MASNVPRGLSFTGELRNFSNLAPEIVENILSFLPARSLVNALLVCHLWKDVSERVLKRRKRWVSRLFQYQENDETQVDEKEARRSIQKQLFEFLDNVDTVPLAMLVATSGLLTNQKDIKSFLTKTQEKLPAGCPVIGCVACGIIGETSEGCPEELEDHGRGISAIVIPKVKGVNVHKFSFSKHEISKNKKNTQSWRSSFQSILEEDIKFVFLIGQTDMHQSIGKVAMGMKKVFGKHVVIIGGLARPFTISNGNVKCKGVIGLAVGGNVHANSVVHHGSTQQTLPGTFKWLTKEEPPEKSACFMVSCMGKGTPFYNSKNVESSEFGNAFPGVRLFGFFGNGEVGTCMPAKVEHLNKNSSAVQYLHSYSTVFSILTLLDEKAT